ncbi:hypothetical protein BIV25_21025 [Streptomyces sp. MUSC 14]|nr:hypothetical protein BIV25_21025 [Streptomyces sp. MUSC 14]
MGGATVTRFTRGQRHGLTAAWRANSRTVQDQVDQTGDQGLFQWLTGQQDPRQQGARDGLHEQVRVGVSGQFPPLTPCRTRISARSSRALQ